MAAEAAVAPEVPTEVQPATATPVAAPPPKPSKHDGAGDAKADKGKQEKKGKKDKKGAAEVEAGDGPSIAAHPRAVRAVARAKGWGGLAGFVLGGYLSMSTGTLAEAGLRALAGGVICYVVAWAGAVFVWRRLVIVEMKAREQQLVEAAQAALSRQSPAGESATARTAR